MVRPSIAVVTFTGRDGQQQGLGTGFVVDAAGLVATNLHVVGEGRPMIQLAMPIEPGNSGGPVVDPEGRMIGVVTIKSLVTKNLGFAVRVAALKPLLEKPNPVPMSRWLTIGRLGPARWSALFGARWQQRGGLIAVSGSGAGFGGMSLCLAERQPPALPFDLAVSVTLDDEAGGALTEKDTGVVSEFLVPTPLRCCAEHRGDPGRHRPGIRSARPTLAAGLLADLSLTVTRT